ncbi:MAG: hypothetical protein KGM24_05125, partial [Elusimicrobia bacterium]|nr:hypothetical protein [Elusimicrobiota bacterium]
MAAAARARAGSAPAGSGPSAARVAALLALFVGAVALYASTLKDPPVWDDHTFVFGQPFLLDCRNLSKVLSPLDYVRVLPERNSARPVWQASILADTCLGGGDIRVYRLTSAYWHALGAVLVAALGWALTGSFAPGLAAGILFAADPLHTEPVDILTFRTDLLALAFMIGTILLWREGWARAGRRRAALLAAAALAAALALLSKETAVVLPLLLLLSDALFPPPAAPARARRWGSFAVCSALVLGYLVFRAPRSGYVTAGHSDFFSEVRETVPLPGSRAQQGFVRPPELPRPQDPPWSRVYRDPAARFLTMSRVFASYLRLLVWPHPLQGDYAPRVVDSWTDPGALAGWLGWLAVLAAAWLLRRRAPLASFGLGWAAITLLPVSNLIAIYNLQADRYLYAPSAGVCLAAGALLWAWG